jgi:glycosyltransferase involved in cell wall biosynthesis
MHRVSGASRGIPRAIARRVAQRRSRILYVCGTSLVPSKVGPARRNHHIIDQLSRFYDVTVVAFGMPDDGSELRSALRAAIQRAIFVPSRQRSQLKYLRKLWHTVRGRCDYLPVHDPALRSTVARLATGERFDVVMLSTVFLARLPLPPAVPVVADTHNVEYDVHRRIAESGDRPLRCIYARRQCAITKAEEEHCGQRVGLLLATSDRDRRLFEDELRLSNVAVVPNGIDVREFRPAAAAMGPPVIVFSGLMSYYPNQQGVRWFLNAVFPEVVRRVPDVRLVIAGAAPPPWLRARQDSRVYVTGAVPDMRPYLAQARAVIVPLQIGGGTRVKILEAQAMGKPVVSTTIGAEGLEQDRDVSILIADAAAAFASQVVHLLVDDIAASRVGNAGRRHVLARFDWDAIGVRLARALEDRMGLAPLDADPELRSMTC